MQGKLLQSDFELVSIQAGRGRLFCFWEPQVIVASGIAMQFEAKPLFSDVSHRLTQARLILDGQHPITIQLRGEPRVLQSFRCFVGNVPAAGQFVRGAGVVE